MRRAFILFTAMAVLCLPMVVTAAGPHDNNCTDCHSIHDTKADPAFGVEPNTSEKYRHSGAPAVGIDSLCLGCHNEDEGIAPIHFMKSHPVGLKPVKATVPAELLNDQGLLSCASCHDPHPSNPNAKYLRVATDGGRALGRFCALCHEAMVDKSEL
ncbi:MAG: cytochrome C [bacterium]|nr:MAG: cytochrome C [bacterium]